MSRACHRGKVSLKPVTAHPKCTDAFWVDAYISFKARNPVSKPIECRQYPISPCFRPWTSFLTPRGTRPVRLPARSPNLNAFAERFVLSIKSECLSKIIPLGERHLRSAIDEYMKHYHAERNHQGLGSRIIDADKNVGGSKGTSKEGLAWVAFSTTTIAMRPDTRPTKDRKIPRKRHPCILPGLSPVSVMQCHEKNPHRTPGRPSK